jgi:flagellar basal body-associated protein FliL
MAEETATEGAPEAAAPKKKLPLPLIGMGLQLVVLLICAGVIGKVALFPSRAPLTREKIVERAIASVRDDESKVQTVPLEAFTVNLQGRHVIRTVVEIEVSNSEFAQVMAQRKAPIKAKIIEVLGAANFDELNTIEGKLLIKDSLREALHNEIASLLHNPGAVREVYFTEFLLK